MLELSPSWPEEALPQVYNSPFSSTAAVCEYPQDTLTALYFDNPSTKHGDVLFYKTLGFIPNFPSLLFPIVYIYPLLAIKAECSLPHDI